MDSDNEDDGTNDLAKLIEQIFWSQMEPIRQEMLEFSARIGTQRHLLSHLYAQLFQGEPERFETFMAHIAQNPTVKAHPMADDDLAELHVRMATHHQRFAAEVLARIRSRMGNPPAT